MDHGEREAWVKAAQKGDKAAFAKLYEDVYKDLYKTAYYTLRNPQDAEDVVSDTVVDAFRSIYQLKNYKSFRPWIYKIMTNKCKQVLKYYTIKHVPLEESEVSYEIELPESVDVRDGFMKLEDNERLIVSLATFGGYNSSEIAHMLHMNANNVRSMKSRALHKLKEYVK